jgi:hypothetical protein
MVTGSWFIPDPAFSWVKVRKRPRLHSDKSNDFIMEIKWMD